MVNLQVDDPDGQPEHEGIECAKEEKFGEVGFERSSGEGVE